jgi:hypothetical protein
MSGAKSKQVAVAKKSARRMAAYKAVFTGPEGEMVLQDLMRTHWIGSTTFDEGNPRKMVFREGERNVVLRILTLLQIDLKEYQERIKSYEESI